MTTQVVTKTSCRVGQVTWRISTRTSCRKPRHRRGYSPRRAKRPATSNDGPRLCVSSFFNFPTWVAIVRYSLRPRSNLPGLPSVAEVAGEEGFEPPLSVLETDGLPLNLLPFTLSGSQWLPRRVYPERLSLGLPFAAFPLSSSNQIQFLLPAPTLQLNFPFASRETIRKLLAPDQFNWTSSLRKFRPESTIVFLDARCNVIRNPDIERRISAPQHVTKPGFGPTLHLRPLGLPFGRLRRPQGKPLNLLPYLNYFTSL
jgi:hypothetical protein